MSYNKSLSNKITKNEINQDQSKNETSRTNAVESEEGIESVSEDEVEENSVQPATIDGMHKEGLPSEASTLPTTSLFGTPKNDSLALHRLHFEMSRLLTDKNNSITYTNPLKPGFNVNFVLASEGSSRSSLIKKNKATITILEKAQRKRHY